MVVDEHDADRLASHARSLARRVAAAKARAAGSAPDGRCGISRSRVRGRVQFAADRSRAGRRPGHTPSPGRTTCRRTRRRRTARRRPVAMPSGPPPPRRRPRPAAAAPPPPPIRVRRPAAAPGVPGVPAGAGLPGLGAAGERRRRPPDRASASVLGRTFDTFGREWSLFLVLAVPAAVASLLQMLDHADGRVAGAEPLRRGAGHDRSVGAVRRQRDRGHGGRGLGAGERGRRGPPVARRAGGHRRHDPAAWCAASRGPSRCGCWWSSCRSGVVLFTVAVLPAIERPADRRRRRPGRGADADRRCRSRSSSCSRSSRSRSAVAGAAGDRARGGHAGQRDPADVAPDPAAT